MMHFNSTVNWQGRMLGRYRMVQLLGRGSMAEVWLAEDMQLRRQVAIKLLPVVSRSDQRYLQDFEREARAATELHHPNILPVHDFGQQQIGPDEVITYVVMPLVSGGSLRERIRQANGPLPTTQALHYLRQAATAIDYAHSRNVLHRDMKPANMLLQQDQLLLADFGLARLLPTATQGRTYTGVGTPENMAPEQAQGQPTPASDLYSLAMCAYQLFTGRLPFTSNPDEPPYSVLMKQIQEVPIAPRQFNPALPPAVEQAILRGLAKSLAGKFVRYTRARDSAGTCTHASTSVPACCAAFYADCTSFHTSGTDASGDSAAIVGSNHACSVAHDEQYAASGCRSVCHYPGRSHCCFSKRSDLCLRQCTHAISSVGSGANAGAVRPHPACTGKEACDRAARFHDRRSRHTGSGSRWYQPLPAITLRHRHAQTHHKYIQTGSRPPRSE